MYLDKQHNPLKNKELIFQYTNLKGRLGQAVKETDTIFEYLYKNESFHPKDFSRSGNFLSRLVVKKGQALPLHPGETKVDHDGNAFPFWKEELEREYRRLEANVTREVSVTDFGAVGDGRTDCTAAFKKAIGSGLAKVHIPEGTYIVRGIRVPSWTILKGAGKGKTVLKLHDSCRKNEWVVTNSRHFLGNRSIFIESMSLDWNVERLGKETKTSAGNNRSSCLTLANVRLAWVKDVEAINGGLHGFDVSSSIYTYLGDGTRARGGSKYIWLDNLNGYGFGDDGITTHHSDYILISNSHMCDPSGRAHKRGFSNSNGIEIDDGSRNVWLVNNSTTRCFGGVEIKAHHNVSAASGVHIIGHLSVEDNRSYNFRHIGHHKQEDPESLTAYNIKATGLVSIRPIHTALYEGSKPRGMVISAYRNVVINHFVLEGDPDYDYQGEPVIAVQYMARNISLSHISLKNFKKAGSAIKVFGGDNKADYLDINHVSIDDYKNHGIEVGRHTKRAAGSMPKPEPAGFPGN
ncbi:glycosyl hydrolase family 28-related protein [Peribacillus kribbensis]|uniref:glycosyl hydrolase family 28-related protein n=1 Tax=Peribacillus kribbensis TaxID=356658 RepID=UPI0006863070|nr:glycosyl hydrolase family 28-related protein [Peribacillus kribbensis]